MIFFIVSILLLITALVLVLFFFYNGCGLFKTKYNRIDMIKGSVCINLVLFFATFANYKLTIYVFTFFIAFIFFCIFMLLFIFAKKRSLNLLQKVYDFLSEEKKYEDLSNKIYSALNNMQEFSLFLCKFKEEKQFYQAEKEFIQIDFKDQNIQLINLQKKFRKYNLYLYLTISFWISIISTTLSYVICMLCKF